MDNIALKQSLSSNQLAMLESEMKQKGKNMVVAYLLWWFLGIFGGHRFYTGDIGYAIAMLLLSWMTCGIWTIVDAFFLHKRVNELNTQIEYEIIQRIKSSSSTVSKTDDHLV